jgi:DNA-binding CsgD family transcriptional regulator
MCDASQAPFLGSEAEWAASGQALWWGLEWAFDAVDVGLVFLDGAGQPLFANAAARRISAEKNALKISHLGLATADLVSTRELLGRVCELASMRRSDPVRMRIERRDCDRPLLLTLVRIPNAHMVGACSMKTVVAVFIRDLAADLKVDRPFLATAFDLTKRESEIAALLGQGASLQSIARTLKIRLGTVRSHLKRVFHKTGTRTQLALVMLTLRFADPLHLG